jgi:hypothetical protein
MMKNIGEQLIQMSMQTEESEDEDLAFMSSLSEGIGIAASYIRPKKPDTQHFTRDLIPASTNTAIVNLLTILK